MNITKEQMIEIVQNSSSRVDVLKALGLPDNGARRKLINNLIFQYELDISHFPKSASHEKEEKSCPICNKKFIVFKGSKRDKTTCSHGCANTYFRSLENHPNWKGLNAKSEDILYRRICFAHHKKECVVCGENKIVEVHHYDGDHGNNESKNLIPLCPTHHKYWHSKYRNLVKPVIDDYIDKKVWGSSRETTDL